MSCGCLILTLSSAPLFWPRFEVKRLGSETCGGNGAEPGKGSLDVLCSKEKGVRLYGGAALVMGERGKSKGEGSEEEAYKNYELINVGSLGVSWAQRVECGAARRCGPRNLVASRRRRKAEPMNY